MVEAPSHTWDWCFCLTRKNCTGQSPMMKVNEPGDFWSYFYFWPPWWCRNAGRVVWLCLVVNHIHAPLFECLFHEYSEFSLYKKQCLIFTVLKGSGRWNPAYMSCKINSCLKFLTLKVCSRMNACLKCTWDTGLQSALQVITRLKKCILLQSRFYLQT